MELALGKFHEINGYLLENGKEENGLGLLHGKLGLCIYFYQLARKTENQEFLEAAENLIGEVYEKLSTANLTADFENGLAGIAWGISYLVNSDFVDADLDDILSELDDKIYMYLENQRTTLSTNFRSGIIGYLFYCFDRLESSLKSGNQSNIYIFQKIGAELLNQLGQLIEEEKLQGQEPQLFSIFWDLPLTLIVLGKAKRLNVNPKKSERILDYLLPTLISLFPRLHSNRLYLLLGFESVLMEIDHPELRNHALFLKRSINMETVFNKECKNLNICIQDGVCGLRIIGKRLEILTGQNFFIPSEEKIWRKINDAGYWGETDFYRPFKKSIGLISGLSGIGWALLDVLEVDKKSDIVKV